MGVTLEPSPVSGGEGDPTCAKRLGRGGGPGGDLGVGKARPGPRSHRALPEHPPRWPFLVWCRGAAGGAGPCF